MEWLITYLIGFAGMFTLAMILSEKTHDKNDSRLEEIAANGVIAMCWPLFIVVAFCFGIARVVGK